MLCSQAESMYMTRTGGMKFGIRVPGKYRMNEIGDKSVRRIKNKLKEIGISS